MSTQIKQQFKELAELMRKIEDTTLQLHSVRLPMPLQTVDLILVKHGVTKGGEDIILAMLLQSEKVQISECRTQLLPRERAIDL